MAVVDNITEKNVPANDFLRGSRTQELAGYLTSGNIAKIADDFKAKIRAEISKGLSVKALSLEGRAPLNDIALEMLSRIDVTIDDIMLAKTTTEARGNDHTIKEADKFLTEVLKKYQELCKDAKESARGYNQLSYVQEYTEYTTNADGERTPQKRKRDVYVSDKIKIDYSADRDAPQKITMEPTSCPSRDREHFGNTFDNVKSLYETAAEFYDTKVQEAYAFWNEAKKLTVPSTETPVAIPEGEERPYGVHPDAKKQVITGGNGQIVIYTNPDGSTVEIRKERGKETTHKVKNRYGYTTETIHYNEDGSIAYKNKWDYTQPDKSKPVYEASYTRYELDEKGKWVQTGETTSWGYSYPDKDGNVINRKAEPTADQIGKPISRPGSSNYEQGSIYGMNNSGTSDGMTTASDNSGTAAPPSETTKTDASGTEYTVVTSDRQLKEVVKNKEPFVLEKGNKLHLDFKTGNSVVKPNDDTGDYYYKYNENSGYYEPYDSEGNHIGSRQVEDFKPKVVESGRGKANDFWEKAFNNSYFEKNNTESNINNNLSEEEIRAGLEEKLNNKTFNNSYLEGNNTESNTNNDLSEEQIRAGLEEKLNNNELSSLYD